jgi:leader peptidase (prepilin peptidase)/N-methyltransferase
VKLAGVLGLWLEFPYIPVAIEMACLSAITYVFARRIVSGQPIDSLAKLPFGAFLAPAIWVSWMLERILS